MNDGPRLLLVGDEALSKSLLAALPGARLTVRAEGIPALWEAGQHPFDAIVIQLNDHLPAERLVRSLREVLPAALIIAVCKPAAEPVARSLVAAGADDYLLEPVEAAALQALLQSEHAATRRDARILAESNGTEDSLAALDESSNNGVSRGLGDSGDDFGDEFDASSQIPASVEEVQGLVEVLQNLSQGLRPTAERLASLICGAMAARYVRLETDDVCVEAGKAPPMPSLGLTIQESLFRQGAQVGQVSATYHTPAEREVHAPRLADYARLIEVVSAQALEREQWRDLAWTDDVTRIRNRRYFERALHELLERARAQRRSLTVLLFDIDGFKDYNDRYGHATGDALIREVAQLLLHCSRESDVVARYGGDEFAVILWDAEAPRVPGSHHPREPIELADRFCRAINEHHFTCLGPEAPGPVTISGGLATFPWDAGEPTTLLDAADQALLIAKRSGKNRIMLAGAATARADT